MLLFLRQWWWKLLCIPLLFYALSAAVLTPLGPGINSVKPSAIARGAIVSLDIICYNTHFKEDDPSLNVILKNENNLICNNLVTIVSSTHLNVEFGIPPDLRTDHERDYYNLIIYNKEDGTFFLRNAFAIERNDTSRGVGLRCTTIMNMAPPAGKTFPNREILYESIRNLFFHVPMWFAMIFLTLVSFACSIAFLAKNNRQYDELASTAAGVGVFFGILGLLTGMQWANFTWGAPWVKDPKLNGAALGLLIYFAYFVLRGSLSDQSKRARVSAVYNVIAFVLFIVFIFVVPRLSDTLHPGSGGNPAFNAYDLDDQMRPVFYASAAGYIILSMWLVSISARYKLLLQSQTEKTML